MSKTNQFKASTLRLLILSPLDPPNQGRDAEFQTQLADSTSERFAAFLSELTGLSPSVDLVSFSGYTSHPPLEISTKYYSTSLSLWCDELPPLASADRSSEPNFSTWLSEMLSPEAREVREVIGGIIVLSSINTASIQQESATKDIIEHISAINSLRDAIEDESGRDIAILMSIQDITPSAAIDRQPTRESGLDAEAYAQKIESACLEEHGIFGWNIVSWRREKVSSSENTDSVDAGLQSTSGTKRVSNEPSTARNEFGEKVGFARIREVLEQVDWSARDSNEDLQEADYDLVSTNDNSDMGDGFVMPNLTPNIRTYPQRPNDYMKNESDEFQREIMGLHFALEEQNDRQAGVAGDSGSDAQVEQLTGLMDKVIAIREAGAEMSKPERERFARREIDKIMRDMNFDD